MQLYSQKFREKISKKKFMESLVRIYGIDTKTRILVRIYRRAYKWSATQNQKWSATQKSRKSLRFFSNLIWMYLNWSTPFLSPTYATKFSWDKWVFYGIKPLHFHNINDHLVRKEKAKNAPKSNNKFIKVLIHQLSISSCYTFTCCFCFFNKNQLPPTSINLTKKMQQLSN